MNTIVPEIVSKGTGRPSGVRGYETAADRERAMKALVRRGLNHFVYFKDVQSDYALAYGWAQWAADRGYPYVDR